MKSEKVFNFFDLHYLFTKSKNGKTEKFNQKKCFNFFDLHQKYKKRKEKVIQLSLCRKKNKKSKSRKQ